MNRIELGKHGEDLAVEHLESTGLTVIDRNWHCPDGEIDIVAVGERAGETTLVFCEVKTRRGLGYGTPLEAITELKVRRLRRLMVRWLHENRIPANHLRLDAIGVLMLPGHEPVVEHVAGIDR